MSMTSMTLCDFDFEFFKIIILYLYQKVKDQVP